MKRSKLGILALAAAGGALALAPAVHAESIDGGLLDLATQKGVVGQSYGYQLNDQDTSTLYRTADNLGANFKANLVVGDVLAGSFKFDKLQTSDSSPASLNMGAPGSNNEVTGIYAIQVASITDLGGTAGFQVTFEAVNTAKTYTDITGSDSNNFASISDASGTMFKLYQDSSNNTGTSVDAGGFNNPAASDGDLYATAGVVAPTDIYSVTLSTTDLAKLAGFGLGDKASLGSLAHLSIIDDGTSDGGEGIGDFAVTKITNPLDGSNYDVSGSVDIFGSGTGAQGVFSSKDSFSFQLTVVPVPASVWTGLALMGLLGAGMVIRRRRQMA